MQITPTTLWTTPWLRPLNDVGAIDDLLAQLHPTWSLGRIKARVLKVVAETPDTKTFVLRPNRNWGGFRAGQHVGVEVEIGGVRYQRRYSLSSLPSTARVIAITVKRQPGGKVSNWLHDHLHVGSVLALEPAGSFTLPTPLPARLLMLSAGSGITPMMSMLRALTANATTLDLAFVHVAPRPEAAIFAPELAQLAASVLRLRVHHHYSAASGRFDLAALRCMVPDFATRATFLCGPTAFMTDFVLTSPGGSPRSRSGCRAARSRLTARPQRPSSNPLCPFGTTVHRRRRDPLLIAAEQGGLRPRYGCRMGICHTCSCVKRSGTVENVLTGEISSEPGERIQLCISRARTDLTLDL